MNTTIQDLALQLHDTMLARDFDMSNMTLTFLQGEVKRAIGQINSARRFTPTDKNLYDAKYEHLIIPLCLESIAKIGAEGEKSHTENGVARVYTSKLLLQVTPLIK